MPVLPHNPDPRAEQRRDAVYAGTARFARLGARAARGVPLEEASFRKASISPGVDLDEAKGRLEKFAKVSIIGEHLEP